MISPGMKFVLMTEDGATELGDEPWVLRLSRPQPPMRFTRRHTHRISRILGLDPGSVYSVEVGAERIVAIVDDTLPPWRGANAQAVTIDGHLCLRVEVGVDVAAPMNMRERWQDLCLAVRRVLRRTPGKARP